MTEPPEISVTQREAEWLQEQARRNNWRTFLEFGPGWTTGMWKELGSVVSVEEDPTWREHWKKEYPALPIYSQFELRSHVSNRSFDVAFVDSPHGQSHYFSRLESCLLAAEFAPIIILHDTNREGEKRTIGVLVSIGWRVLNASREDKGLTVLAASPFISSEISQEASRQILKRTVLALPSVASVVFPLTSEGQFPWYMATVALRTLRESTNAHILVLHNNTPTKSRRDSIELECKQLGIEDYRYIDGPYAQSKFWNQGIDATTSKYIAFVNQDSIFFKGWLDGIVSLWEKHPEYFALWPWCYDENYPRASCPNVIKFEDRIHDSNHPCTALVLRRDYGYRFDERYRLWEMDADLMHYFAHHKLKTGICMNARVDHFNSTLSGSIDLNKHYGITGNFSDIFYGDAILYTKAKWGIK